MTNFEKRALLEHHERRFLDVLWSDLMYDVEENLLTIEDADSIYQFNLNYIFANSLKLPDIQEDLF